MVWKLILVQLNWVFILAQQEYCRFTPLHTLCINQGIGPQCGLNIPTRGITLDDIDLITRTHNLLRSRVALGQESRGRPGPQPPASDMRDLTWDNELAVVAQRHADQCIFEHECGDCRRVGRFSVGQNLFISFQSNFDTKTEWQRAINAWYIEVEEFDRSHIRPFRFSSPVGHYTQMLWSQTHKIGCGYTMFQEGGWWKKLYTCNYGPGGNIISTQMYRIGNPCSECPVGTSCSLAFPGLCVDPDASKQNVTSGTEVLTNNQNNATLVPNVTIDTNSIDDTTEAKQFSNLNSNLLGLSMLVKFFNNNSKGSSPDIENNEFIRSFINRPFTTEELENELTSMLNSTKPTLQTASVTNSDAPEPSLSLTKTLLEELGILSLEFPLVNDENVSQTDVSLPSTRQREEITTPFPLPLNLITLSNNRTLNNSNNIRNRVRLPPTTFRPSFRPSLPIQLGSNQDGQFNLQNQQQLGGGFGNTNLQNGGLSPQVNSVLPFLREKGITNPTQVFKTNSLTNVRNILLTLPPGTTPLILFRSGNGELTEIDNQQLELSFRQSTPQPRFSRNSLPINTLLICDLEILPCEVSSFGGNWSTSSNNEIGKHMTISLGTGLGSQVLIRRIVEAPISGSVCISIQHQTQQGSKGNVTDTEISQPNLQIGVWPLGRDVIEKSLSGTEGIWELSAASFSPIKTPFLIVLNVGPNQESTDAVVSIGRIQVTDGAC